MNKYTPLTITEAAKHLKVSKGTIRNLVNSGQLQFFRIGAKILITEEHLTDFIEKSITKNNKNDKVCTDIVLSGKPS